MLSGCASDRLNLGEQSQRSIFSAKGSSYKIGKPYKINGQWYYPAEDYDYSEVGTASWYGEDFHAKYTANGEIYNMNTLTAAHRTLPLPSIVRVTNLENGKSIIARVNDRGPYVKNRIIDLSEKGAELLGYKNKGVAKVKVEILERESRAIKEAMLSPDNSSKTYGDKLIPYSNRQTVQASAAPVRYEISRTNGRQPLKYTSEISLGANTSAAVNIPSAPGEGPYFVQVGAFADYDKANEMADAKIEAFKKDLGI